MKARSIQQFLPERVKSALVKRNVHTHYCNPHKVEYWCAFIHVWLPFNGTLYQDCDNVSKPIHANITP